MRTPQTGSKLIKKKKKLYQKLMLHVTIMMGAVMFERQKHLMKPAVLHNNAYL